MKECDRCKEKPVYIRRYSGQIFCKDHFIEYFNKKFYDTLKNSKMIKRGDHIGIGLSGGKDSVTTLHILKDLENRLDFTVVAISIDEGIQGYREKGLETAKTLCKENNIPWYTISFQEAFEKTLDKMTMKGDLGPCTYCGVFRRRLLNNKAKELGLNSIATGHNLDDEVQTIFMNYIRGDIDRLARLSMRANEKRLIKRIKPLKEIPEKEVALYSILMNYNVSFDECPYAEKGFRTKVRDFINELELDHPGIKFSILRGYEKIIPSLKLENTVFKECISCGEATPNETCKACSLLSDLNQSLK